jgi:hypothetical protein
MLDQFDTFSTDSEYGPFHLVSNLERPEMDVFPSGSTHDMYLIGRETKFS